MDPLEDKKLEIQDLCQEYDINFLAVFGSTARGTDREDSDVDLLVTFNNPVSLIELVRIEREFSRVLDNEVDLVTEQSLHSYVEPQVRDEMIVLYDRAA